MMFYRLFALIVKGSVTISGLSGPCSLRLPVAYDGGRGRGSGCVDSTQGVGLADVLKCMLIVFADGRRCGLTTQVAK